MVLSICEYNSIILLSENASTIPTDLLGIWHVCVGRLADHSPPVAVDWDGSRSRFSRLVCGGVALLLAASAAAVTIVNTGQIALEIGYQGAKPADLPYRREYSPVSGQLGVLA